VLRTACDGWDDCTIILQSGAHPDYKADPEKPIEYAFIDLLLTRGEGALNEMFFANAIEAGVPALWPQAYVIEKLRRLVLTEHGDTRSAACRLLWNYSMDGSDPKISRQAYDALKSAKCRCPTVPKISEPGPARQNFRACDVEGSARIP